VLNACASVLALEEGRCAHEQIIQIGWHSDVFVRSTLVDMYAKCGSMEAVWSHLEMWPLGMAYLEHVPYMGIIRNLLNIFIGSVKLSICRCSHF
jgi:hypothetical protein